MKKKLVAAMCAATMVFAMGTMALAEEEVKACLLYTSSFQHVSRYPDPNECDYWFYDTGCKQY